MDEYISETDELKIGIGGIKFSEELVHIAHRALAPDDRTFADLIHGIAEKRINIPFVCSATGPAESDIRNCCCIHATDFFRFEQIVDTLSSPSSPGGGPPGFYSSLRQQLLITRGVGTLTIFPHRRSLALLGRVVEVLGRSGIDIYSLCTSISALAVNVDFHQLDFAVKALRKIVDLPEDHAPFRPEFCVRQISP